MDELVDDIDDGPEGRKFFDAFVAVSRSIPEEEMREYQRAASDTQARFDAHVARGEDPDSFDPTA